MHDYFPEYYTPTPPTALVVVRTPDIRVSIQQFFTDKGTVVDPTTPIPVKHYDYIFLTFEPSSAKELVWYHEQLRPLFSKASLVSEFGSVRVPF